MVKRERFGIFYMYSLVVWNPFGADSRRCEWKQKFVEYEYEYRWQPHLETEPWLFIEKKWEDCNDNSLECPPVVTVFLEQNKLLCGSLTLGLSPLTLYTSHHKHQDKYSYKGIVEYHKITSLTQSFSKLLVEKIRLKMKITVWVWWIPICWSL